MKTNKQIAKLTSAFISAYFATNSVEMDIARIAKESVFEIEGDVRISLESGLPLSYYDGHELLIKFMDALGEAHGLLVEVQNPGCLAVCNA